MYAALPEGFVVSNSFTWTLLIPVVVPSWTILPDAEAYWSSVKLMPVTASPFATVSRGEFRGT